MCVICINSSFYNVTINKLVECIMLTLSLYFIIIYDLILTHKNDKHAPNCKIIISSSWSCMREWRFWLKWITSSVIYSTLTSTFKLLKTLYYYYCLSYYTTLAFPTSGFKISHFTRLSAVISRRACEINPSPTGWRHKMSP